MYKNIVGIIGAPRSGTSWTGQIFDSAPDVLYRMQPFYSWAFRDRIHVRSTKEEIKDFFDDMYLSKDPYLEQRDRKEQGVYPVFEEKSKCPRVMVFKEVMFHYMMPVILRNVDNLKLVAIVRNPVDVITSYWNAPREFAPFLDIQKEWYFAQTRNELLPERYFGYHKWKEYIKIVEVLENTFSDRVKIIRYEDLRKEPEKMTKELFEYSGIAYTPQTERFLYDSQNKTVDDPYSVFRNKHEQREKKSLPENIINQIYDDLKHFEEAERYGYTREC